MAKMLCREMSFPDQCALASLAQHPGFDVLTKLMDDACTQSTAEPIKLDPADPIYESKLTKLTLIARAKNEFCSDIRASINAHVSAAIQQDAEAVETAEIEADTKRIQSTLHVLTQQSNKQFEGEE